MLDIPDIRQISPEAFSVLGTPEIAYIRPIEIDGQKGYGIFRADGAQMAVVPTREVAIAIVRQNDMEPVNVH